MSWAYADSQKTLRKQQLKEEELRRKEEEDLARAIKESLKTAKKWQYSCPLAATIAVHTYHVQIMSQIEHAFSNYPLQHSAKFVALIECTFTKNLKWYVTYTLNCMQGSILCVIIIGMHILIYLCNNLLCRGDT